MDPSPSAPVTPTPIAALLAALEEHSRSRPDRVLRLRGLLPPTPLETGEGFAARGGDGNARSAEAFELLIFRGFSSLTTHPTAFDPDRPALPEGTAIESAELLRAPLDPTDAPLAGPFPAETFLDPPAWS